VSPFWEEEVSRTFRTAFLALMEDCRIRPTVEMMSYWKCTTAEITKSFHASTIVFSAVIKIKIVRKRLLYKLQWNTRRQQKIGKAMMTTRSSVNEWLTRMLGNLLSDPTLFLAERQ
jgi:hypothetical protein